MLNIAVTLVVWRHIKIDAIDLFFIYVQLQIRIIFSNTVDSAFTKRQICLCRIYLFPTGFIELHVGEIRIGGHRVFTRTLVKVVVDTPS